MLNARFICGKALGVAVMFDALSIPIKIKKESKTTAMKKSILFIIVVIFSFSGNILNAQTIADNNWPMFRGPDAKGYLENSKTVENWNLETGENVLWKTKIPGLGHSCPVIWENKLFVTTAISGSGEDYLKVGLYGDIDEVDDVSVHEFKVYCLDKTTGNIVWEKLVHKGVPRTKRHTKASHANPTPATDGKHLIVFFGSEGLYCFDMDGELKWKNDLGTMNAGPFDTPEVEWGFASSPIIHKGQVIVQCDFIGDCHLSSYDLETGKLTWRTPREEIATWSSPNIYEKDGVSQIIVNGWKHMGAYDFETGNRDLENEWRGRCSNPNPGCCS